jgi:acetyl esterase/lipase
MRNCSTAARFYGQRLLVSLFFACLAVVSGAGRAQPMTLQGYMQMQGPSADEHISYGPASSQFIEYFRPTGHGPFPVVIIVHGGCWMAKYEGIRQVASMARSFADRGYAAYSIEYRGIDEDGGGYPGMYEDIGSALDSVRKRATSDDLDLKRITAIGHSAGAQLVLWAAGQRNVTSSSPRFVAHPLRLHTVIGLGALPDLADRSAIRSACGIDPGLISGEARGAHSVGDTSPASMLPLDAHEIVLINGSLDGVSPPATVKRFAMAARQRGNAVQVVVVPGASHYDEVSVSTPVWKALLQAVQDSSSRTRPETNATR